VARDTDPIPTTIIHPFRQMFYAFYGDLAKLSSEEEAKFTLSLMETNDYDSSPPYFFDYEVTSLVLLATQRIERVQFRLIVPMHYVYGGFLDPFLDAFHDITNTLKSKHNIYGKNRVKIDFYSIHEDSPFFSFGNIELEAKTPIPNPYLDAAVSVGVKFPTGTKKLFSSKKPDYMAGLYLYKEIGGVALNFNFNMACLSKVEFDDVKSERMLYSYLLSLVYEEYVLEFRHITSPFISPHRSLSSNSNVINLGYRFKNFEFFLSENIAPFYGSPDITFGINYRF